MSELVGALPTRSASERLLRRVRDEAPADAVAACAEETRERAARRARGERNPPVPGRGRRAAVARVIRQTDRNIRNLYEAQLAARAEAREPRRLRPPDDAYAMLPDAQAAVDEVRRARDAYYAAIADALPPHTAGTRPSGADAARFAEVRSVTGLDPAHLRRIQRTVHAR
ncbi:hypothetical protein [Streptomyces sp. NBRC 109706]|uniref:hypothetical protein n=1 Tax=Streptomyces sp. NBRC 109706 TaxID=1550035 RepID=UPI000781D2FF|nr:hypothetical protein [Streptomyces sp. NBRC 109706]